LTREYLPVIKQFHEEEIQRSLLHDSTVTLVRSKDPSKKPPSVPVSDELPKDLEFLGETLCDPGFDKLNLSQSEIEDLTRWQNDDAHLFP